MYRLRHLCRCLPYGCNRCRRVIRSSKESEDGAELIILVQPRLLVFQCGQLRTCRRIFNSHSHKVVQAFGTPLFLCLGQSCHALCQSRRLCLAERARVRFRKNKCCHALQKTVCHSGLSSRLSDSVIECENLSEKGSGEDSFCKNGKFLQRTCYDVSLRRPFL